MKLTVTTVNADGTRTVDEQECSPEMEQAVTKLQEAYVGFPWCKCDPQPDADFWSYFEHKHGVSHGWEHPACGGVVQVG